MPGIDGSKLAHRLQHNRFDLDQAKAQAKLRSISDNPGPSVPYARYVLDYPPEKSRDTEMSDPNLSAISAADRNSRRATRCIRSATPDASVQMCLHLHDPSP
ncbi:hypothetical protein GCM10027167_40420 [Nocardia heshunensis]